MCSQVSAFNRCVLSAVGKRNQLQECRKYDLEVSMQRPMLMSECFVVWAHSLLWLLVVLEKIFLLHANPISVILQALYPVVPVGRAI